MQVGNNTTFKQRATFLAAVCSQTYVQFNNPDGSFVVPFNYSLKYTIMAKSAGNIWERFGFILESPEEIIIAFRGTSSTTNWISDIIASQKRFKYIKEYCLTHRGFTDIYATARNELISALSALPAGKTLTITGHSLGAALATLCAVDAAANTAFTSPVLYTYGSPRVGDPAFKKVFNSYIRTSYRIANTFDAVTFVPPTVYKLPKRDKRYYYNHVPELITLTFQLGAVGLNHIISSYFAELAKLDPVYAGQLCQSNPGFCPATIPVAVPVPLI
jgi:triacylglycerol lipase